MTVCDNFIIEVLKHNLKKSSIFRNIFQNLRTVQKFYLEVAILHVLATFWNFLFYEGTFCVIDRFQMKFSCLGRRVVMTRRQ